MTTKSSDIRNYHDLSRCQSYEDRFEYLALHGKVGNDTFGFDRIFNQKFYSSKEWKRVRNEVIIRDSYDGEVCDMGDKDHPIAGPIYIHHMNPLTLKDISEASEYLLDPQYLVCVSRNTHNAIHYGNSQLLPKDPIERQPGDTCPWKKG